MAVRIVSMYPEELNLYADYGNVKCIDYRLKKRGYDTKIIAVGIGDKIPDFDIMLIGGGQDREMQILSSDIRRKAQAIRYYIESNKVIFAVCGGYQMLGHYYKTDGEIIKLSSVLPFYTVSNDFRMIGNVVVDTHFGKVVGFENHSGRTFLCGDLSPLGDVVCGYGNNGSDGTEGMVYKNTFGTYLHGPVLPKNPNLADELIRRAVGDIEKIDDTVELACQESLIKRFC